MLTPGNDTHLDLKNDMKLILNHKVTNICLRLGLGFQIFQKEGI